MIEEIRNEIEASISVKQKLLAAEEVLELVAELVDSCLFSLNAGGKVIFAGNGGSFADAQHLSAEFTSRFMFDRAPLASVALATNSSAMSAIGNDYGFEKVFARELEAIANPMDTFVPISTSGNSPNILAAIEVAAGLGVSTFALTGHGGGLLAERCKCIRMPSIDTARIQESHILVGHIVCAMVEAKYFERIDDE